MKHPIFKVTALIMGIVVVSSASAWTKLSSKEEAMLKTPNLENGKVLYEKCAICHSPEGWDLSDGRFSQIAGQHPSVIIKQLSDIRNGNRDNPTMYPFAMSSAFDNPQDIADVAAYISKLPMNPRNIVGPGFDLELGEKLYVQYCAKCHKENGEGNNDEFYPRVHGQHYYYLLRQMQWIVSGKRRNVNPTLARQLSILNDREIRAVVDYISRLRPPKEMIAEPGWYNPDFPMEFRSAPLLFEIIY